MAHLAGRCDCGRTIHIPKGSAVGTTWECWNCGTVWTLVTHGRPIRRGRSRAPPAPPPAILRRPIGAGLVSGFLTGVGTRAVVGLVLGTLVACYLAYHLLGPIGPVLLVAALVYVGRIVLNGGRGH